MVDILNVLYAVRDEVQKCIPQAQHYMGKLPADFQSPCFLYLLVFNEGKQESYFTKQTTLELRMIYFGNQVTGDLEESLQAISQLKSFLDQFNLQVQDRNLKFTYHYTETDDQLAIIMQFKFKDEVINPKYESEQAREKIKTIYINEKEMI